MAILLPLISNLILNWTWLGQQVASVKPSTVHVIAQEEHGPDALFQILAENQVPWMYHNHLVSPPTVISHRPTVIILVNSLEKSQRAVSLAASHAGAYRARYIIVLYGRVKSQIAQHVMSSAWTRGLAQVVVILLKRKSIYAAQPKCRDARAVPVPTLQWPDFQKVDLKNCNLRISAAQLHPVIKFQNENDSSLTGVFEPFFRYVKAGLKFQARIIETPVKDITGSLISGDADMAFFPLSRNAEMSRLDTTFTYSTELAWCVPDFCVLEPTIYFLWREFQGSTWIFLALSVVAVCISLCWLTPPGTSTHLDTIFKTVATLVGVPVDLRFRCVRGILFAWLPAALVLSTCYQTILHSMMMAPSVMHKVANTQQLLKSDISLVIPSDTISASKQYFQKDAVLAALMARAKLVDLSTAVHFQEHHQGTHATYMSVYACNLSFRKMKSLKDGHSPLLHAGLFSVASSSWLAPALRRIAAQGEASGLNGRWFRRGRSKTSCSINEKRGPQPITVALIRHAILLWYAGLALAFIVFLIELSWRRRE